MGDRQSRQAGEEGGHAWTFFESSSFPLIHLFPPASQRHIPLPKDNIEGPKDRQLVSAKSSHRSSLPQPHHQPRHHRLCTTGPAEASSSFLDSRPISPAQSTFATSQSPSSSHHHHRIHNDHLLPSVWPRMDAKGTFQCIKAVQWWTTTAVLCHYTHHWRRSLSQLSSQSRTGSGVYAVSFGRWRTHTSQHSNGSSFARNLLLCGSGCGRG